MLTAPTPRSTGRSRATPTSPSGGSGSRSRADEATSRARRCPRARARRGPPRLRGVPAARLDRVGRRDARGDLPGDEPAGPDGARARPARRDAPRHLARLRVILTRYRGRVRPRGLAVGLARSRRAVRRPARPRRRGLRRGAAPVRRGVGQGRRGAAARGPPPGGQGTRPDRPPGAGRAGGGRGSTDRDAAVRLLDQAGGDGRAARHARARRGGQRAARPVLTRLPRRVFCRTAS